MSDYMLMTVVTISGMLIVFLVLILLIVIISVLGKIMYSIEKGRENRSKKKSNSTSVNGNSPDNSSVKMATPQPVKFDQSAGDEITPEIIAVISAAIAASAPPSYTYILRKVKKARKTGRSAWGNLNAIENTRPF